jgi:hypothetical protein
VPNRWLGGDAASLERARKLVVAACASLADADARAKRYA